MTAMEVNPLELIQLLAMEEASMDFALPGFLRLLNKCFSYCNRYTYFHFAFIDRYIYLDQKTNPVTFFYISALPGGVNIKSPKVDA